MKIQLAHPATGTRYDTPLYVSSSGRAFYPIGGASDDGGDAGGGDGGDGDDAGGGDGGDDLGEAGKKALETERSARKQAERDRKSEKAAREAAEARIAELESGDKTDQEKAIEAARKEAAAEAKKAGDTRLISAELRALAAEAKMRDPRDAIAQLRSKLDDIDVDDDGEVDSDSLTSLLKDLKKAKPYLFEDGSAMTASAADAGIGGTGGGGKPEALPGRPRLATAYANTPKK